MSFGTSAASQTFSHVANRGRSGTEDARRLGWPPASVGSRAAVVGKQPCREQKWGPKPPARDVVVPVWASRSPTSVSMRIGRVQGAEHDASCWAGMASC